MRIRRNATAAALVAALTLAAMWSGCSDDDIVFCQGHIPDATLENIWPNADSTYWEYRVTVRIWHDLQGPGVCDSLYETPAEVPPAPSLDDVEKLLAHHDTGDSAEIEIATYRMEFAGDTTSSQGVAGQNLRESVSYDDGRRVLERGATADPLLERLWLARPDLRRVIENQLGWGPPSASGRVADLNPAVAAGCFEYPCPLLIHGGVWRKTEQFIGTYADLDTLLSWKFLEADLGEGHEFTHQLVPSLAGDVFLHCRVAGVRRAPAEKCVYRRALDCVYLVDYGVYEYHGPGPGVQGYCRSFDYGRVLYVPEVGPVSVYERMLVSAGDPPGKGIGDRAFGLTSTGRVPPTRR